jgi:hypothetical protein
MRIPNPFRPLTSRLGAALWSVCGRRRLRRGDARGAIQAFGQVLRRRPGRFLPLMQVAEAHLCARETVEARRYLAQAREADPVRYEMRASAMLARGGFDLERVCRPQAPNRPEPVVSAAGQARPAVTAANLPFGDCRDVDEYARFRAMPPITPAEIDALNWDRVLGDLMDD